MRAAIHFIRNSHATGMSQTIHRIWNSLTFMNSIRLSIWSRFHILKLKFMAIILACIVFIHIAHLQKLSFPFLFFRGRGRGYISGSTGGSGLINCRKWTKYDKNKKNRLIFNENLLRKWTARKRWIEITGLKWNSACRRHRMWSDPAGEGWLAFLHKSSSCILRKTESKQICSIRLDTGILVLFLLWCLQWVHSVQILQIAQSTSLTRM